MKLPAPPRFSQAIGRSLCAFGNIRSDIGLIVSCCRRDLRVAVFAGGGDSHDKNEAGSRPRVCPVCREWGYGGGPSATALPRERSAAEGPGESHRHPRRCVPRQPRTGDRPEPNQRRSGRRPDRAVRQGLRAGRGSPSQSRERPAVQRGGRGERAEARIGPRRLHDTQPARDTRPARLAGLAARHERPGARLCHHLELERRFTDPAVPGRRQAGRAVAEADCAEGPAVRQGPRPSLRFELE